MFGITLSKSVLFCYNSMSSNSRSNIGDANQLDSIILLKTCVNKIIG